LPAMAMWIVLIIGKGGKAMRYEMDTKMMNKR